MATGYIIWSRQQRKQVNTGVMTSTEADTAITRIQKKGLASEALDKVQVTY